MLCLISVLLLGIIIDLHIQKKELETKLDLQKTENRSLRRVLFENDLIPEKFVKESE